MCSFNPEWAAHVSLSEFIWLTSSSSTSYLKRIPLRSGCDSLSPPVRSSPGWCVRRRRSVRTRRTCCRRSSRRILTSPEGSRLWSASAPCHRRWREKELSKPRPVLYQVLKLSESTHLLKNSLYQTDTLGRLFVSPRPAVQVTDPDLITGQHDLLARVDLRGNGRDQSHRETCRRVEDWSNGDIWQELLTSVSIATIRGTD